IEMDRQISTIVPQRKDHVQCHIAKESGSLDVEDTIQ
uniref:Uncharacterized protein n=1 Tax=Caenorhabditis japonica TaxID=281687 RepID=A0A8R1IFW4_CAEJA